MLLKSKLIGFPVVSIKLKSTLYLGPNSVKNQVDCRHFASAAQHGERGNQSQYSHSNEADTDMEEKCQ